MRKLFFLISLVVLFSLSVFSQNNPLTTGSNNVSVEKIQLTNKTDIDLIVEKKVDVQILQSVRGISTGFKFIPILPFLPKHAPGIVNIDA